jgi:hypothetical protein
LAISPQSRQRLVWSPSVAPHPPAPPPPRP